eukprot:COSAG01_NODE_2502_length_7556_cov_78.108220_8_plen_163_part_00
MSVTRLATATCRSFVPAELAAGADVENVLESSAYQRSLYTPIDPYIPLAQPHFVCTIQTLHTHTTTSWGGGCRRGVERKYARVETEGARSVVPMLYTSYRNRANQRNRPPNAHPRQASGKGRVVEGVGGGGGLYLLTAPPMASSVSPTDAAAPQALFVGRSG